MPLTLCSHTTLCPCRARTRPPGPAAQIAHRDRPPRPYDSLPYTLACVPNSVTDVLTPGGASSSMGGSKVQPEPENSDT